MNPCAKIHTHDESSSMSDRESIPMDQPHSALDVSRIFHLQMVFHFHLVKLKPYYCHLRKFIIQMCPSPGFMKDKVFFTRSESENFLQLCNYFFDVL